MADPLDPLDIADKVSSVVGAAAGILSLVITVRGARRTEERPGPAAALEGDPWLRAALISAAAFVLVLAARLQRWHVVHPPWILPSLAAATTVAIVAFLILSRVRGRRRLAPVARRVLVQLEKYAIHHRHNFGEAHVPGVDEIYVEQRAVAFSEGLDRRAPRVRLTVRDMLAATSHSLVLGGPGAGKSTMILHVAYEGARAWLGREEHGEPTYATIVPIPADVRTLAANGVAAAIAEFCSQHLQVKAPVEMFERAPGPRRHWLVLVDSLDEVLNQDDRSRLLRALAAAVAEKNSPYRFLIASRPLDRAELAELRTKKIGDYDLRVFEPADLTDFAMRWFRARNTGRSDAEIEEAARRFLTKVRESRLEPVVRIPLLATIAVLVHDNDRDSRLPASRGGLYRSFVENLVRSRAGVTVDERAVRAATGIRAAAALRDLEWLDSHVLDLLETVAHRRLWEGNRGDLLDLSLAEAEAAGRPATPGIEGWWEGRVRDALIRSGTVSRDKAGFVFVHQSIAEYLAAGVLVRDVDLERWTEWLDVPGRRSIALFVLARTKVPLEPMISRLLTTGRARLAAYVLADGINLPDALRTSVIRALLDRIDADADDASECLSLLEGLLYDVPLRDITTDFMRDGNRNPWARAAVCDLLVVAMSDEVRPIMRSMARDPGVDREVRIWMADRLAALGEVGEQLLVRVRWPDTDWQSSAVRSGGLVYNALKVCAEDPARQPRDRAKAAAALLRFGDPLGQDTLYEIIRGGHSPATRMLAVSALLEAGRTVDADILLELAAEPQLSFQTRLELNTALAAVGSAEAFDSLADTVIKAKGAGASALITLNTIVESSSPASTHALRTLLGEPSTLATDKLRIALILTERHDDLGPIALAALATDFGGLAEEDRRRALRSLVTATDRETAMSLAWYVLTRIQRVGQRRRMTTALLGRLDEIAGPVLHAIATDRTNGTAERLSAVRNLTEIDDPRMSWILETIAISRDNPFILRATALVGLARAGREFELDVLVTSLLGAAETWAEFFQLLRDLHRAQMPGMGQWLAAQAENQYVAPALRAAAADVLADDNAGPLIALVRDHTAPESLRTWACARIMRRDAEVGVRMLRELLDDLDHMSSAACHAMLDTVVNLPAPLADRLVRELAASTRISPTLRFLAVKHRDDGPVTSEHLAWLILDHRLGRRDREEAARLLAARSDPVTGWFGWQIGTQTAVEPVFRAWALVAAAANGWMPDDWYSAAEQILLMPWSCPAGVRYQLMDLLPPGAPASRDLLTSIAGARGLDRNARLLAALILVPEWAGEGRAALAALARDLEPTDWRSELVEAALDDLDPTRRAAGTTSSPDDLQPER